MSIRDYIEDAYPLFIYDYALIFVLVIILVSGCVCVYSCGWRHRHPIASQWSPLVRFFLMNSQEYFSHRNPLVVILVFLVHFFYEFKFVFPIDDCRSWEKVCSLVHTAAEFGEFIFNA